MQLNGDLCADLIGSNPVQPPIVDHSWLDVDLDSYDNYPSDNNSVRVLPKLSELWNHSMVTPGTGLVPNMQAMPAGVRSSEIDPQAINQVVKEAKKAVMSGLTGKKLASHLRTRFTAQHLGAAHEALKKVAEEIGLLGNVYIDASAFNTYQEAEQFLSQNRSRLARDILLNTENMHESVTTKLASTFHKNVVSAIIYDEALLNKYRDHLIQAKRIPSDTVIASKEDLRQAFLYVAPVVKPAVVAKAKEKVLDKVEVEKAVEKSNKEMAFKAAEDRDSVLMSKIGPIASFVQENLAKGKTAKDIKEMVKTKFVLADLKDASEALGVVLSKEGLVDGNVDSLIKEGKISLVLGSELKKIGKKFPIKATPKLSGEVVTGHSVGTPGYMHSLESKKVVDSHEGLRKASVEALKKGFDVEQVKARLMKKLSEDEASKVLLDAVLDFNTTSAGVVANKPVKQEKVLVAEVSPKQTLPDPSTIAVQTKEILGTFEGCSMSVDVDAAREFNTVEIGDLLNSNSLDNI